MLDGGSVSGLARFTVLVRAAFSSAGVARAGTAAWAMVWVWRALAARDGGSLAEGAGMAAWRISGDDGASCMRTKPASSSLPMYWSRATGEGPPMTTPMMRLLSRTAEAARLKPEARMKPVLMPSAPSYQFIRRLWLAWR